ncbi:MAG: monovalent cation/H+ antiporter complex subunit F [Arenicella sp.]
MMFIAMLLGLLVAMLVALSRSIVGPTIYDRILAANSFGTKIVLLIPVYGFVTGRPEFIDIALAYALINFIGTIAILKYFEFNHLGRNQFQRDIDTNSDDAHLSANTIEDK